MHEHFSYMEIEYWMSLTLKDLGTAGEAYVCSYLENAGFSIFKKNWRTPYAEIDIVATKGRQILIAEVKTRFIRSKNKPLISQLGVLQRRRLVKAAHWVWCKNRRVYPEFRCVLFVVTKCGIETVNLPLLYDHT